MLLAVAPEPLVQPVEAVPAVLARFVVRRGGQLDGHARDFVCAVVRLELQGSGAREHAFGHRCGRTAADGIGAAHAAVWCDVHVDHHFTRLSVGIA